MKQLILLKIIIFISQTVFAQDVTLIPNSNPNPTPDQIAMNPTVSKIFVIQNIATEKIRVYERCDTDINCPHRLILEADMVVGRPEEGSDNDPYAYVTQLGHSKIKSWVKFYQDRNAHYPHWYKEGQSLESIPPKAPKNKSGQATADLAWGRKWMTNETIYVAFGWYAAILTPSNKDTGVNFQWIHGTIGWASDQNAPIRLTRTWLLNVISNPGSSGCTRLSNDVISYLRHILPVGSDIFRIYSKEATREKTCLKTGFLGGCKQENILSAYTQQKESLKWNYTMLTNEAQKTNGLTADSMTIEQLGIPVVDGVNLIEKGIAEIDQYPNPVGLNYLKSASSGESGDRYSIDDGTNEDSNFKGVYLVDEGRFIDYQHPMSESKNGKIKVSGLIEFQTQVPEVLKTTGNYFLPKSYYIQKK